MLKKTIIHRQTPSRSEVFFNYRVTKTRLTDLALSTIALALTLGGITPISSDGLANIIGNDTQNFNPTTNGLDYVTVQSSKVLEPGIFNLGLFFNHATNTLPRLRDRETNEFPSKSTIGDQLMGMDMNIGVGLIPGLEVGLSLPQILDQTVKDKDAPRGQFSNAGVTEIRASSKYRLIDSESIGVAVAGSINFNQLKNNPYAGKNGSPTVNIETVTDTTWNDFALAFNFGYRWRESTGDEIYEDSPIDPLGNQWIASLAASYRLDAYDTKIISEIFTSWPVIKTSDNTNRASSAAELLLGAKYDISHNVALHGGFGTELSQGISSPDLRIYAGINWTTGPEFSKQEEPTTPEEAVPTPTKLLPSKATDPFSLPPKAEEKIIVNDLLFAFDSDKEVINDPRSILSRLVEHLKKGPGWKKLIIDGYTDSLGNDQYNLTLSYRRANNIRKQLIEKFKLPPNKILAIGHGEENPIASNNNYQGRRLNRRVELRIYRK